MSDSDVTRAPEGVSIPASASGLGTDGGERTAYDGLVSGVAIAHQPQREWLVITGEDRRRFINGLVTCDVRDLPVGSGVYGFCTSTQGRVLADLVVTATGETLVLDLPATRAQAIAEHMLRYRVADRVEIERQLEWSQFMVAGPDSASLLQEACGLSGVEHDWGRVEADGMAFHRDGRLGVPAIRVLGLPQQTAELAERLERAGAVRAGDDDVAAVRIERGVPWFGVDFGQENFPQETGLQDQAVSYSKGCYLGQEIVARIHYRGQVNRRLRGLRRAEPIVVGTELFADGEKVGEVTSCARSPLLTEYVALAMVHRKAAESVTLPDKSVLALVDLPFVSS